MHPVDHLLTMARPLTMARLLDHLLTMNRIMTMDRLLTMNRIMTMDRLLTMNRILIDPLNPHVVRPLMIYKDPLQILLDAPHHGYIQHVHVPRGDPLQLGPEVKQHLVVNPLVRRPLVRRPLVHRPLVHRLLKMNPLFVHVSPRGYIQPVHVPR